MRFASWWLSAGNAAASLRRWASCTVPTKRKPLRGKVLIRRCPSPVSPIAFRAASVGSSERHQRRYVPSIRR